ASATMQRLRPRPGRSCGGLLQRALGAERVAVAADRGDSEELPAAQEADLALAGGEVADGFAGVPAVGVADVGDADIVVLAPEKGNVLEGLRPAEHAERGRLAHALGDHPVLDA